MSDDSGSTYAFEYSGMPHFKCKQFIHVCARAYACGACDCVCVSEAVCVCVCAHTVCVPEGLHTHR